MSKSASLVVGLTLLIACSSSNTDSTPACNPETFGSTCKCAPEGQACTSSAECCGVCDYATKKCAARSPCNPVTNAPCNAAAGESCYATGANYDCQPRTVKPALALCAPCMGNALGCPGGTTCSGNMGASTCAKLCCGDGDCGSGKCMPLSGSNEVGVCITEPSGDATCDAPATPPSGGSCFTMR